MTQTITHLRLILGDQLNELHSWFTTVDDKIIYTLIECKSETDYATHHIQKIIGFFAAMRSFADLLQSKGHRVHYIKITDPNNQHTISANCQYLLNHYQAKQFEYQMPDEYRLDKELAQWSKTIAVPAKMVDTEHFLSTRYELRDFFGDKQYLMETFYRYMRKKHGILMQGNKPFQGVWNLDKENRKQLPKGLPLPVIKTSSHDVTELYAELSAANIVSIGAINPSNFGWTITRTEALELLEHFCNNLLPGFGSYQDTMHSHHWALYHSRLSFALNLKLLHPLEVINKAIETWHRASDKISYNQLEGFIRQLLGWREFMRGVYWSKMPAYESLNYFQHQQSLPEWYWTGQTKMKCLSTCIRQSLEQAYAHHIQRLMVTGNFALLAGCHPDEVDAWYLGIYIDALQWVEITNTRGMSQFADGGIVGSKPYISSGAYIKKMSNYCSTCFYAVDKKTGERSCPFNSLYWNFFDRHYAVLSQNPRTSMMAALWQKMPSGDKVAILKQAEHYLQNINTI